MIPGKYRVKLIEDQNKNGRWDPVQWDKKYCQKSNTLGYSGIKSRLEIEVGIKTISVTIH